MGPTWIIVIIKADNTATVTEHHGEAEALAVWNALELEPGAKAHLASRYSTLSG